MRWVPLVLVGLLIVPAGPLATGASAQDSREISENAQMEAVAVARTEAGNTVGTVATISVSVSTGGDGRVYIDTQPLAGTDMQGSARIAARVAASTTGYAMDEHDFYFVVRSDSPIISGPSAGSVMALAATVALENTHRGPNEPEWNISREVLVTGTINPDGSIGPVGGIPTKAQAAAEQGAGLFLVPEGQGTVSPRAQEGAGGEPVEITEFCETELGIECREVRHLKQLVELATGYRFVEPALGEPPTTAGYEDTLRPLADQLIERGRIYEDVWARLNESREVPQAPASEIVSVLRGAQEQVQRAEANVDAERFYSAASRAFAAAIQARHAKLLLAFYTHDRSAEIVEEAIGNASAAVDSAREAAGDANVTGMQDLYTVGAAQKRVSDAEQRLRQAERAWNGSQGAQPSEALRAVARSIERSATVHWWLELGEAFEPGAELPVSVDQLADEMSDLADEMLAYTTQILGNRQPGEAAASMRQVRENERRGFHAGAAIEAAEVQVISALSVELRAGQITDSKLDQARDSAVRAIQEARGRNVEPILPIALFEFGGVQEEPGASLRFYRVASVLAGLTGTLETASQPTETEFVGAWEGEEKAPPVGHSYRSVAAGWFTAGFFGILVLALFGLAIAGPRNDQLGSG